MIQPSEVEDRKIPPTLTISQISEQRIGVKSKVTKVLRKKIHLCQGSFCCSNAEEKKAERGRGGRR